MHVHSSLRLSIFDFSSLINLFLCALSYLCVSFKSMAIAKHRSQHNFAQFSSFSCILSQISRFLVTFAVFFTSLHPA